VHGALRPAFGRLLQAETFVSVHIFNCMAHWRRGAAWLFSGFQRAPFWAEWSIGFILPDFCAPIFILIVK